LCHLDGPAFGSQHKLRQSTISTEYRIRQIAELQNFLFCTSFGQTSKSALLMIDSTTLKVVQEVPFEPDFLPSALVVAESSIFVGLTHLSPDELKKTQPESGNIIKYIFDGAELIRETQCESFGSVMDLAYNPETRLLFAGINSKIVAFDTDLQRLNEVQG
jgi:hypothetical protein